MKYRETKHRDMREKHREHREKTRANESFHDRVAPRYDQVYTGAYWDFYREVSWGHVKKFLPSDLSFPMLDLGCGTGEYGLRLAKSGYRVTLVDLSRKMLDQARQRAEQLQIAGRCTFVKANLEDLGALPEAGFSFAVAQGDPLSCCVKYTSAVTEIWRVLRPGAIAVISVDHKWGGIRHFFEKNLEGLEEFARSGRTEWLTEREEERFPLKMFDPDELRSLFEKQGFAVLDLIGKLVLPIKEYANLLEDRQLFDRLLTLERKLHRTASMLSSASHLQISVRKD